MLVLKGFVHKYMNYFFIKYIFKYIYRIRYWEKHILQQVRSKDLNQPSKVTTKILEMASPLWHR